eukprot:COSAG01_NODE_67233_length_267_cov_1.714286_1_plen_26_part_01
MGALELQRTRRSTEYAAAHTAQTVAP